jgi:hypothetical protein
MRYIRVIERHPSSKTFAVLELTDNAAALSQNNVRAESLSGYAQEAATTHSQPVFSVPSAVSTACMTITL